MQGHRVMRNIARLASAVLAIACLCGPAAAQTAEEKAGARAMAQQGVAAYEEQRWLDAIDLFRRAEKLFHAPTHLLYLARSQAKAGQLVEAGETYELLKREQLGDSASKVFLDAQNQGVAELQALRPRIPYVTITVTGAGAESASVTVDGETLSPAFIGVARPMNPGKYVIEAKAQGASSNPFELQLAEGKRESVVLELVATGAPGPSDSAAAAPVQASVAGGSVTEDSGTGTKKIAAYSALGVGAAGVAVGVIFALQHSSKSSDADDLYDECLNSRVCGDSDVEDIKTLDSDAATAGTLSIVGFGVGAAGIGVGLALLLMNSGGTDSAAQAGVVPYLSPGQVGLTGSF